MWRFLAQRLWRKWLLRRWTREADAVQLLDRLQDPGAGFSTSFHSHDALELMIELLQASQAWYRRTCWRSLPSRTSLHTSCWNYSRWLQIGLDLLEHAHALLGRDEDSFYLGQTYLVQDIATSCLTASSHLGLDQLMRELVVDGGQRLRRRFFGWLSRLLSSRRDIEWIASFQQLL